MIQKSIQNLHTRIRLFLNWSWIIFFLANLIFLTMFIAMNFLELGNSSMVWKKYFLDRMRQVQVTIDSSQPSPIPIVHALTIGADGTILKAPTPILQGMRLNDSGFFGKIHNLQLDQIAIIFFPDMVDGIQRVHFVKRLADTFIVNSFEPNDFFPITLVGKTNLSVVSGDVIWFSVDPSRVGNIYTPSPVLIDSGRLFISFADKIPEMLDARLVITQDITGEMGIMLLTAFILTLVFGSISMGTVKIQKDVSILQTEHRDITQLIQSLSAVILNLDDNAEVSLGNLIPALRQSLRNTQNIQLQFEEHRQYQHLLQKVIEDLLKLVDLVQSDGAIRRESEARLRGLSDNLPGGMVYQLDTGIDGELRQFTFISAGVEKLHGIASSAILQNAQLLYEQIIEDDRKLVTEKERQALVALEPFSAEIRFRSPQGDVRWGLLTSAPRRILNGHLIWDGIEIDITERKQVEQAHLEAEERYRSLAEATFEGIAITQNGVIQDANLQLARMFGYNLSELFGRHLLEFIVPEEQDLVRQVIISGVESDREYRGVKKDGTSFFIRAHGRVIEHGQGHLRVSAIRDISKQKQSEEALRASETRYQDLFENIPIGIYRTNWQGNILDANPALLHMLGYASLDEIANMTVFNIWAYPEERGRLLAGTVDKDVLDFDFIVRRRDGSTFYAHNIARVIRSDQGEFLFFEGTLQDISERKLAEDALRRSEAKFRAVVENSNDGILFIDPKGVISYRSPSYNNINGYSDEERLGHSGFEMVHPDDMSLVRRTLAQVTDNSEEPLKVQYRIRHKDGTWRWIDVTAQNLLNNPDIQQIVVTSRDITERKQAGDALRASEAKFRAVVEHSHDGIVFMNAERKLLYISPSYWHINGVNQDEVIGQSGAQFVHPDDQARVSGIFNNLLQMPGETVLTDYRTRHKDGSWRWIETRATNLLEEPNVQAVVLISRDISVRKQAEEKLRKSEEKFSKTFMFSPAGICIQDIQNDLRFLDVNEAFLQLTGYARDEVIGKSADEFGLLVDPDSQAELLKRTLENSREHNFEYRFRKKNRQIGTALVNTELIDIEGKPCSIVALIDISERKQAREQLEASLQQLHSLSRHLQSIREEERASIAREIHDELGQALTALKMELYLLKNQATRIEPLEFSSLAQTKLTGTLQEVDQTIDWVRRISTYLRPSILDSLGLVPALDWLAKDFETRYGIHCSLKVSGTVGDYNKEFATAVFRICQEALTNILRHAHASQVDIHFNARKDTIDVEVRDNGRGITASETQAPNSLGLLGMQERALALHGSVDFKNSRGGGTIVVAHFPANAAAHLLRESEAN